MSVNSQIKDVYIIAFFLLILLLLSFLIFTFFQKKKQKRNLTHAQLYYIGLCISFIIWSLSMIMMGFTPDADCNGEQFWDAMSNIGTDFAPLFMFFVVLSIVREDGCVPKWANLAFVVPAVTVALVFTNDYHELVYRFVEGVDFSIIRKDFTLGPVLIFKGIASYLYLIGAIAVMLNYAIRKKEKLVWKQSAALILGAAIPLTVSILATAGSNLPITATPLSFAGLVACNYIAIYRLNILNIIPIATSKVLDMIPDGFLILDNQNRVLECNASFVNGPGKILQISKNDILNEEFIAAHKPNNGALYTLLSNVSSCGFLNRKISFEQTLYSGNGKDDMPESFIFIVDIQFIEVSSQDCGHIVVFRDITELRRSLAKIQENRARLLEQERLAMLGQMMGGMAHNMKTPIMNIAGGTSNIETLLQEVSDSLGDDEVTDDDYREIVKEVNEWLGRIRESCSYMSEIINAVKGQAATATNTAARDFAVEEVLRSTELLMKHELKNNNTQLSVERKFGELTTIYGDMNSLVQVLNNLISNAIYATKNQTERKVVLSATQTDDCIEIRVQDNGPGIAPETQKKLFHEMVTTKGAKGTGLGLYISSTIIRGKFGGKMWYEDAPEGGAVLCLTLPLKNAAENGETER